ncbi:MAG: ABC-2 family transporter protein [Chloroflexota bacterium]|nr:ABC-2 family transporter protein [Chloroflexota bacterium]
MSATLRKTRTLLAVWFAHMSAYRAEIVIWMLTGAVPLIMLAIWIGKARVSGGSVQGFMAPDFAAYFLGAWITQQWIVAWVSWEISNQIRTGTLSPRLLRPLDPMWDHAAGHLTERLVRLPFIVVIVGVGLLLVPGTRLTPDAWHALAFVLCINLAFAIRFLIAYCTGLLAFWFDQATAIDELYYVIAAFLTGSFAPLAFYPPLARAAIEWTPFPYLVYYPVRVLTGAADGLEIVRVLGVQLVWLCLCVLLRGVLWRRGLQRYGAVGA